MHVSRWRRCPAWGRGRRLWVSKLLISPRGWHCHNISLLPSPQPLASRLLLFSRCSWQQQPGMLRLQLQQLLRLLGGRRVLRHDLLQR